MIISKEIEIDACHRVCYHNSKCRWLHWHRYKIEVWVEWEIKDEKFKSDYWMIIDFWDLKKVLMEEIDAKFDHWAIFFEEDIYRIHLEEMMSLWDQNPDKMHFVNFMPTVENLCKYWFELIEPRLKNEYWIELVYVKTWETPNSTAIYSK